MLCVAERQQGVEGRSEGRQFVKREPKGGIVPAERLIRLIRRANRFEICCEVGLLDLGQVELLGLVEPVHDGGERRQRPIMEVWCSVDRAKQGGRVERTVPCAFIARSDRPDVMRALIEKV